MGIIGFGRIGQEVAKIAIGCGMNVIVSDPFMEKTIINIPFFDGQSVSFTIESVKKEVLLKEADFVTLHVPAQKEYIIGKDELAIMKNGAGIINAARGGVIDEVALIDALDKGKLSFAGLDVFENEPKPAIQVLMNPRVSLTPHIGAATQQAQDRIGTELADQIKSILI